MKQQGDVVKRVDFMDQSWCQVDCKVGKPCEYLDEVDFRIIVMTFDRANSLKHCLNSVSRVETMGKRISVEIWIDRSKEGEIDHETILTANDFQRNWKDGRVCIHQRETNAYIDGQWIDTWRPKHQTKEIGLILEDDVDISSHALRWLEAVHEKYDQVKDIDGYSLQMQGTQFFSGKKDRRLEGPETDNIFLYGVLGTWGFSPHPERWREFQDWFHHKDPAIKPYVPQILPTRWYISFEIRGTQRSMWEMWHIYYSHINKLYTVYCNLHVKYIRDDLLLSVNRKEKGLHFDGKSQERETNWALLSSEWQPEYILFPDKEIRFTYEGTVVSEKESQRRIL